MVRREVSSASQRFVHPLSYVRWEQGWTYQDLADLIARRINTASRREKVWRWEHWGVEPDRDTQLALAAELGVARELVVGLGWPAWLPVGEQINVDMPWTADGSIALLESTSDSALADRRAFFILGEGVATSLAKDWQTVDPPRVVSALRGGMVDDALVCCFEQRLPMLRSIDYRLGGGCVQALADSELRLVTSLLSHGHYAEVIGRRLFAIAAELGRIAGWASYDLGLQAAAERYWVAALRAAHVAGDRGIGANVLKSMSLQRSEGGRHGEAVALATAALDAVGDADPRVVAMLTVRSARMHAAGGDRSSCDKLLIAAERAASKMHDAVAPHWAGYFDWPEYCAQVAACYLMLQRYEQADSWLTQNLAVQPDARSRDRATYFMWKADCALHIGEVEHACEILGQAIPDIASAESARNKRRLARLHNEIERYRNLSDVRLLSERLRPLLGNHHV